MKTAIRILVISACFGGSAALSFAELPYGARQSLTPEATNSGWGNAISVDGDLLAVGHHWDSSGGETAGAVTLHRQQPNSSDPDRPWTWASVAQLAPSGSEWPYSWFGSAVGVSGEYVVVGAPRWDNDAEPLEGMPEETTDCGAAWIFDAEATAGADGFVYPVAKLEFDAVLAGDYFGCAVAIEGSTAVVGAWGRDISSADADHSGAAFIFEQSQSGSWSLVASLTAPDASAGDRFGSALALNDGVLVVAAPRADDDAGRVYIYDRNDGDWALLASIDNPGQDRARFGTAVDVVADVGEEGDSAAVIVGAPGDSQFGLQSGTAWVFECDSLGTVNSEIWQFQPDEAEPFDEIGTSIAVGLLFDVDNYGSGDEGDVDGGVILIGAPGTNEGTGCVYAWVIEDDDTDDYEVVPPISPTASRHGQAVAIGLVEPPEWPSVLMGAIFMAAPGSGSTGLGDIELFEFIHAHASGDCDDSERWDFLELADGLGDCNEDAQFDACQVDLPENPIDATEQFITSFDLDGYVAQLTPDGSYQWTLCTDQSALDAWIEPADGEIFPAVDDDSYQRDLGFGFEFFGQTWQSIYVGANGYVTFGAGDDEYGISLGNHFDTPRISVLYHDLDPFESEGDGFVHMGSGPDGSVVVTWYQLQTYGVETQTSTAQLQLHTDGAITLVWLDVDAPNAIVGLSDGSGIPQDFAETDYSLATDCVQRIAVDDCNANGIIDSIEIALGCIEDLDGDGIPDECSGSAGDYDPLPCLGDADRDGQINVLDLIALLRCWGSTEGACLRSDMDIDGAVNGDDLTLLLESFGSACN